MPRGKSLSEKEKDNILNILCSGKSIDGIIATMEQFTKMVWTSIQAPKKDVKAKRSERPPKLSAADKRTLLREAY